MAVDSFIKIQGHDGESKDAKHKNQIDILSWSWGLSQTGDFHRGGGGGAGKVNINNLTFSKWIDISTPSLMLACANGEHIPKAELFVRKAGKDALEYIVFTMEKVIVSGIRLGNSGDESVMETITLNFAKLEFKYVEQGEKGSEKGKKTFKWDVEENKGDVS